MRKFQRKDFINKTFGSRQCIGFRRPSKANKNTSQLTLLCECGNITTQSVWCAMHYPHCKSCGQKMARELKRVQGAVMQPIEALQDLLAQEPIDVIASIPERVWDQVELPKAPKYTEEQRQQFISTMANAPCTHCGRKTAEPTEPMESTPEVIEAPQPSLAQIPTHDLQVLLLAKLRADNSAMRVELTQPNNPQDLIIANLRSENAQLALTATLQEIYLKFQLPKSARINENGSISYEP